MNWDLNPGMMCNTKAFSPLKKLVLCNTVMTMQIVVMEVFLYLKSKLYY